MEDKELVPCLIVLDCKKILLENMYRALEPIQKKQQELRSDKDYVYDVLKQGQRKAKEIAVKTLDDVYGKIGISRFH